jgi:hypothetical protein
LYIGKIENANQALDAGLPGFNTPYEMGILAQCMAQ